MAPTLTRHAFAKLNLTLAVDRPLPPANPNAGFHPIASYFAPIDLADTLAFSRLADTASPLLTGEPLHDLTRWLPTEDDLCLKALRALESHLRRPLPVHIHVAKRIPAGGGLGGGSSNAAATIRAVTDLFDLDIPPADLRTIAASLGSDVPFFLDLDRPADQHPRAAIVTGLGEQLERLPHHPAADRAVLLSLPPFGCSTPAVYRAFDQALANSPEANHTFRNTEARDLATAAALDPEALFNDLAEPACTVEPRLAQHRRNLRDALHRPVHLSGSGSTLFALDPPQHPQQPGAITTRIR